MRRPKQKISADSTLPERKQRKLVLKFFASLCLLGFLVGLMLGDFLKPAPPPVNNQLVEVVATEQGLTLCFLALPRISSGQSQGLYWLYFEHVMAQPQKGQLRLGRSIPVRWQLEQQRSGMQLGFVALQPLRGQWHVLQQQACVQVQLEEGVERVSE